MKSTILKIKKYKNIKIKIQKYSNQYRERVLWNNLRISDKNMEWASNHAKDFPNELKLADITPVLKKDNSTMAKNNRPVSVLPCGSKIVERIMQQQ